MEPFYCILGTCRPIAQLGEACKIDVDCAEGLSCPAGACAYPGNIGAPCKSWKHCLAPHACWNGVCSQCTVAGAFSSTGAACCDDNNCIEPLYCILGSCRPIGGAGCSCGVDMDCESLVCENGYCLGGGGCWELGGVAPVSGGTNYGTGSGAGELGSACQSWQDCVAPYGCEHGKCVQCTVTGYGLPVGSKCCDDTNCAEPNYCILSVCLPPGQAGAACGVNNDCASNVCNNGSCL